MKRSLSLQKNKFIVKISFMLKYIFVIFFVIFVCWVVFFALFFSKSENLIEKKEISPDGKYLAIYFVHMSGGAAGSVTDEVSVLKANQKINKRSVGNIFSAFGVRYLDIKWKDENTLFISCKINSKGIIIKKKDKKYNVKVIYEIKETK